MENFNNLGVHRKIWVLGGVHEKPIYRGGLPKKGAWTIHTFKGGGWQEIGGGVFEGGVIPQCTLWW